MKHFNIKFFTDENVDIFENALMETLAIVISKYAHCKLWNL